MKKKALYFIPIISTITFIALAIYDPPLVREHIENLTIDFRFHIRNWLEKQKVSNDIIIVAIDEESIQDFGRWPWSRKLQAKLIEEILEGEPKVFAIDIFYSEPEANKKADDALLKAIIRGEEKILLAAAFEVQKEKDATGIDDYLFDSAFVRVIDLPDIKSPEAHRALILPSLGENAQIGHVYSLPDRDGKLRWECLYLKHGDEFYPSLALQAFAKAREKSVDDMVIHGRRGVSIDEIFIPTDDHGRIFINYRGKELSYSYISASDILNHRVSRSKLKDKIVLLGTSAISTYDIKITSFSANLPAVEKNATVIDNLVEGDFLRKAPESVNIPLVLLLGVVLGSLLPRLRALKVVTVSVCIMIAYVCIVLVLFTHRMVILDFFYPTVNAITLTIAIVVAKYFSEERKAKNIKQMFSKYVSPKIVDELIRNPEKARLGGDKKIVSILFMDIIGFTSLSEQKQPEEVISIINEYFKEMTDVIFRWDGTLDKFVGDEIMAFWGAPIEQSNHAELALRCALHVSKKLDDLHVKWAKEGKTMIDCGIGLNTGEVLVGNVGAEDKKMDYTIMGDHVNIAARVEKLTRQYDTRILITEYTMEYIRSYIESKKIGHVELTGLATVQVKGKEKELKIYRLQDSDIN